MAEILLFHHIHGLTPGVRDFAATLRSAGHTVHLPDLYDGQVFDKFDDGVAYAQKVGFAALTERGRAAADGLPEGLVYAGFSLGIMPTQSLAQSRPGARGALLFHGCVPPAEFGSEWPSGLPVQIHGMADDPIFAGEGDLFAARALVASAEDAELFLYPGDQHLFADSSVPSYVEPAARLLTERTLTFLARVSA